VRCRCGGCALDSNGNRDAGMARQPKPGSCKNSRVTLCKSIARGTLRRASGESATGARTDSVLPLALPHIALQRRPKKLEIDAKNLSMRFVRVIESSFLESVVNPCTWVNRSRRLRFSSATKSVSETRGISTGGVGKFGKMPYCPRITVVSDDAFSTNSNAAMRRSELNRNTPDWPWSAPPVRSPQSLSTQAW